MDYKKKYEDVFEKAKKVYNREDATDGGKLILESMFPELKESEDEKIRKEIITYLDREITLSNFGGDIATFKEWIAWLEKQDPKKHEEELERAYKCADEVQYRKGYEDAKKELEKQGERKFADGTFVNVDDVREYFVKEVYRVLDADSTNDRANQIIDAFDYLPTVTIEKQGEQKPTNKVESKFKIGDFITDGTSTFQIVKIEDEWYIADDGDKVCFDVIHQYYNLWTIQDAKDGDVLTTKDAVFIFKHMDVAGLSLCDSYCDVIGNSNLGFGFAFPIQTVRPATKEQRDLLFQKMKEAGYEWDAEKKELKRIESVQPELPNGEDYGIDSLYHAERILEKTLGEVDGYQSDDGILEHKCAIEAVKRLYKQKPAWSEKDERMFKNTIALIETFEDYNKAPDGFGDVKFWLKSLKERYTWKPSDEQMEAIKDAIDYLCCTKKVREDLKSLYEQLKKLMEE